MMVDVGYIKGVSMKRDITGATRINASDVRITLKGLEYLQENSMMKKVYNAVKGIKDITPGPINMYHLINIRWYFYTKF